MFFFCQFLVSNLPMGSDCPYLLKVNKMSQQTYGQATILVNSPESPNYAQKEAQLRKIMIDGWITLLIVNVILSIIFPHAWWVFIPKLVLFIKAIEKTAAFVEFKNKKEPQGVVSRPAPVEVKRPEPVAISPVQDSVRFCAACGTRVDEKTKFCSMCGMQIR